VPNLGKCISVRSIGRLSFVGSAYGKEERNRRQQVTWREGYKMVSFREKGKNRFLTDGNLDGEKKKEEITMRLSLAR